MSTGCYQPETLEELRALIASDPRTPQGIGGASAHRNAYAICGMPGSCLVTRALENAKENEPITDIAVAPYRALPERAVVSYIGPDGEYYAELLNSLLNAVAVRFDEEPLDARGQISWCGIYRSKQDCLNLLDKMIAERDAERERQDGSRLL